MKYGALVRAGTWFQTVPAAFQERLLALAVVRRFNSGPRLFARGDPPDGLYFVVEGAVRITRISKTGKEALLAIIEQPQWFGKIALFDGQSRTHDAWSEGASALLHVAQHAIHELLDSHPAYWREFGLLLTQKMRVTFLVLEEAALLPAAGRLARRLVTIAEGYGEWKDRSRWVIQVPQDPTVADAVLVAPYSKSNPQAVRNTGGNSPRARRYRNLRYRQAAKFSLMMWFGDCVLCSQLVLSEIFLCFSSERPLSCQDKTSKKWD